MKTLLAVRPVEVVERLLELSRSGQQVDERPARGSISCSADDPTIRTRCAAAATDTTWSPRREMRKTGGWGKKLGGALVVEGGGENGLTGGASS